LKSGVSGLSGGARLLRILGGNADASENKGVAKIATQKSLKTRELKIDCLRGALRVGTGRRDETGTLSATLIRRIPYRLLIVK
jgi:hypothetical protein